MAIMEAAISSSLSHPNIVQVWGASVGGVGGSVGGGEGGSASFHPDCSPPAFLRSSQTQSYSYTLKPVLDTAFKVP